jgi:hypothetical protein
MDVDEEEEGDTTQRLKKVPDHGIEVDFDILGANEREVSAFDSACFYGIPRPFSYLWDCFDIYVEPP